MRDLVNILSGLGSPRVVLLGDYMLDRYVYGDVERISPEAPVPVLRKVRQTETVGAAGNVAVAVAALGGTVTCVGAIGHDEPAERLSGMLLAGGAVTSSLLRLPGRPTTVKTRFVGLAQHRHAQQMFRVDEETAEPLDDPVAVTLSAAVRGELSKCNVLAIEDYDKGVLTDQATPAIIADARKQGVPVVVDPARISDYRRYRGATLVTPNRYEAHLATGVTIDDDESLRTAARQIQLTCDADAVVITLDRQGCYLLTRKGDGAVVPTRPREVYDVSGAGDAVLAMLAVAVAEGCELPDAVALANEAGGLEVERFGVVPVRRAEILDEMRRVLGQRGGKVLPREPLAKEVRRRRERGEKVVFTNGCFDLLHMGHVRYLQDARDLGGCLIVAINSDDSVRRLKGPTRPVIGESERGEMLASLECVDFVTIFQEDTAEALVELLRPDIMVKGGTTPVVVEREVVESYGGKVMTLQLVDGLSTTQIINRIVERHE